MDRSTQLGQENILKLLLRFSIPAIIGMLVNALYNVVDRIFIGKGVGTLGIAGITISFPIMIITMGFGMLIGIGATSLISIRLGEQKKDEAELIMGNAMILLVSISLILSIFGLSFLTPLLKAFGASEAVIPFAKDYLSIILIGTVFMSIGFGMNNFIRAEGNPKIAMYTMIIGALLNIILDPIFILFFNWGMKGAALATIISQLVSAVWVLAYFLNGKSSLKIRRQNLKIQPIIVGKIMAIGAAPFAMQMAASILSIIINNSLTFYGGDVAVAALGAINSIMTLILMPVFGINQGVQPIIGYNYGAKNYDRVKQALKLAILGATIIVLAGFLLTRLIPVQLIAMFNSEDKAFIQLGVRSLQIFLVFLPIIGFQVVAANYFQAVGKPKQAMILSLSRQILVLIPAVLILPRFFGLDGILYSGPLSDFISSLITGTWLFLEIKNLDKKKQEILIPQPE